MGETLQIRDLLLSSEIASVLRLLWKGISKNTSGDQEEKGFSLRTGMHHWLLSSSNYHRVDKDEIKQIHPKLTEAVPRHLRSDLSALSFSFRGDRDRWKRCSLRFRESLRRARERYRPRSLLSWSTVSCVAAWLMLKKTTIYWFT